MNMTICLAMIVKNESHIIRNTLQNIYNHVPIHYWIISDTGSTDNTIEIIEDFFNDKKIPGELITRKWVNFGHNRTELLDYAFQRTDYLFLFDADDTIYGDIHLPPVLTADAYCCKFNTSDGTYTRPILITNRKPWCFTGVLHEYLDTNEQRQGYVIDGNYYIESGRSGFRNKNPNKYIEDASLLLDEMKIETNVDLKIRYMYFCAQSFRDHGDVDSAIEWYCAFLNEKGNENDRYTACIELSKLFHKKNDFMNVCYYLSSSYLMDSTRIEGIVLLMNSFFLKQNHFMVNLLYHKCKGYSKTLQLNKPFFKEELYDYHVEALNSVSAYQVGDVASGYECCKKVILYSKHKENVHTCVANLTALYKTQYDKDPVLKALVERKFTVR
jgi:glycosyltransferase involved in cell wall biosynthesis